MRITCYILFAIFANDSVDSNNTNTALLEVGMNSSVYYYYEGRLLYWLRGNYCIMKCCRYPSLGAIAIAVH